MQVEKAVRLQDAMHHLHPTGHEDRVRRRRSSPEEDRRLPTKDGRHPRPSMSPPPHRDTGRPEGRIHHPIGFQSMVRPGTERRVETDQIDVISRSASRLFPRTIHTGIPPFVVRGDSSPWGGRRRRTRHVRSTPPSPYGEEWLPDRGSGDMSS